MKQVILAQDDKDTCHKVYCVRIFMKFFHDKKQGYVYLTHRKGKMICFFPFSLELREDLNNLYRILPQYEAMANGYLFTFLSS